MNIWCTRPEEVTVELQYTAPDGTVNPFWIRIKKFLTIGEQKRVETAGLRGMTNMGTGRGAERTTEINVDWKSMSFARTEVYLLDWSLEEDTHKKLPVIRETFEALHPAVYELIENAITAHVEAMAEAKKAKAGKSEPPAMSA